MLLKVEKKSQTVSITYKAFVKVKKSNYTFFFFVATILFFAHFKSYSQTGPCASATTMVCGIAYTATLGTTNSDWSSYTSCGYSEPGDEAVFAFTPATTGQHTFMTSSSSGDADFFLMSTCSNTGTNLIGACWSTGNQTVTLTAGVTYYLIADNYSSTSTATFTLGVDCPAAPTNITACSGMFYDSGGSAGTYSAGEDHIYVICPTIAGSRVQLNFTDFDVEANYDYLSIFDGPNTSSPTLGTYDNEEPILGVVQATTGNASGCLTFVFHSDGSVQYDGWAASISCSQPCQLVQVVLVSSSPVVNAGNIDICQGQTVTFNGSANYPQNNTSYFQSNATSTFTWSFGDGTTATGQNVSHTYNNEGGYQVSLVVTDINGCISSNVIDIRVRVSTTPVFAGTNANPTTICLGQSTTLTGVATPTPWSQPTGAILAGETFLPDGSGVSYYTGIDFTNFSPGQTVNSVNDIVSVCLNMEHTYMGDLQISLSCPNGNSIVLLPYTNGGGGTILGEPVGQDLPVDGNSSNTTPGIGYDYCFSPTSTAGYIDDMANWTTVAPYTDPIGQVSASVNQADAGTYQAYGAWTSLVGCPLNGSWTISVTDNLGLDNGYIFQWGINFNPALYPVLWGFTPAIVSDTWSGTVGSGLTSTGSNPVVVTPTATGNYFYTYSVTDDFGCTYDTSVQVSVSAETTPTFAQLGPYCVDADPGALPTTSYNGITGTWSPSSISTASAGTTVYTFTPTAGQCAYNGTMSVEIIDCNVSAPCPDYADVVASANQHCAGQTYYFEVENTACAGFVSFNVVGNWGSTYANELTWAVTSNLTGAIIIQDNNAGNNVNGANFNVASGAIDPNIQGTVFTLTVYDSYGDGFNGTGGFIVAQQGGVNICNQISGNFGDEAHVMFFANINISPATITITTPGGPVTQTVTNCNDFKVPVVINNSLFCTTASITLPWVVNCETNGSILSSGNFAMTIFPNTPDDISDIVDISFDPLTCAWVSNYNNDCLPSHLGSIFTITPNPNAPVDACEAHYPETFTLQYTGIPSGLACCNTAGSETAVTYHNTSDTDDAVAASTPFGGTNNGAYLTIPPNGTGGSATAITLNFNMSGFCFENISINPSDFWVTIFVDGMVVYDNEFFEPATSASVTLDLTDMPAYDENSVIEMYVYPNTFSAGGVNTTFVPGVNCNTLDDGEWTASYFNLSVDVIFSELVPTPAACIYDASVNKPCCATVTTPNDAATICSGDPFSYAAWQNAVTTANSTCLIFSSVTPVGGTVTPDGVFPNGINGTTAPITQTVSAYAYCDMNGNGNVDAGDLYTLLSTYVLTVNPALMPTFTQLGPYCVGDTPGTLPTTSYNGITGTWSPSSISTASAGTTVYTFTPTAGQCAIPVTTTVVVNPYPIITCPPAFNVVACNGDYPDGATNKNEFNNEGGDAPGG